MTARQWWSAIVLAVSGTLAVLLAVVCLLYAVWLDASPRLREEWPVLLTTTFAFAAIAAAAGVAVQAERRWARWSSAAQALLLGVLASGGLVLYRSLAS